MIEHKWKCPSWNVMRELQASKKSFKTLPYGSYVEWRLPFPPKMVGEAVVDIHSTRREDSVSLVYARGEESIHNTLIKYKKYFWGLK